GGRAQGRARAAITTRLTGTTDAHAEKFGARSRVFFGLSHLRSDSSGVANGGVMKRRGFLKALATGPAVGLLHPAAADAALPRGTITRVRIFRPPNFNPLFNQSNMVVTVETDFGITGIGEGGSKDTLEQ